MDVADGSGDAIGNRGDRSTYPWCVEATSPLPDTVAAVGFGMTIQATESAATGVPVGPFGLAKICT